MQRYSWFSYIGAMGLALAGIMMPMTPRHVAASDQQAKATFAGGCFWCMEQAFEEIDGVISATSGYIGGQVDNPTYKQVSAGTTGHTEAIEIIYNPAKVTYEKLLDAFWLNVDPTTPNRQFCDGGSQYRTSIFYHDDNQKQLADASKAAIEKSKPFKEPVVTPIVAASTFYPAEEYHQDYYKKKPVRYKYYKWSCGRAQRLQALWGKS